MTGQPRRPSAISRRVLRTPAERNTGGTRAPFRWDTGRLRLFGATSPYFLAQSVAAAGSAAREPHPWTKGSSAVQLTIDSTEPLAKVLSVVGALFGVELSTGRSGKRAGGGDHHCPGAGHPDPGSPPLVQRICIRCHRRCPRSTGNAGRTGPGADARSAREGRGDPAGRRERGILRMRRCHSVSAPGRGRMSWLSTRGVGFPPPCSPHTRRHIPDTRSRRGRST